MGLPHALQVDLFHSSRRDDEIGPPTCRYLLLQFVSQKSLLKPCLDGWDRDLLQNLQNALPALKHSRLQYSPLAPTDCTIGSPHAAQVLGVSSACISYSFFNVLYRHFYFCHSPSHHLDEHIIDHGQEDENTEEDKSVTFLLLSHDW